MHRKTYLILLAGALLLIAGCTQPALPDSQVSSSSTSTAADFSPLTNLAITGTDLPISYTIIENRTKSREELSPLAIDLGWEAGYMVRSATAGAPDGKSAEITQTIALYPNDTIHKILLLAEAQDRSDKNMVFSDLVPPVTGDFALAFHGTVSAITTETPAGLMHTSITGNSGDSTQTLQNFSEVLFVKGNVFEVIRIRGAHVDDDLLQNLSESAYQKIP
jgi:hypothetical protein